MVYSTPHMRCKFNFSFEKVTKASVCPNSMSFFLDIWTIRFQKLYFPQLQMPLLWWAPNSFSVCLLSPQYGHLPQFLRKVGPRRKGFSSCKVFRGPRQSSPSFLTSYQDRMPSHSSLMPSGSASIAWPLLISPPFSFPWLLVEIKAQLPKTALKTMPLYKIPFPCHSPPLHHL